MEGRCRRCGEKLSLLQRLQGQDFCSPEHKAEFQREQEEMALARLQQTASNLKKPDAKPVTRTGLRDVSSPSDSAIELRRESEPPMAGFSDHWLATGEVPPLPPELDEEELTVFPKVPLMTFAVPRPFGTELTQIPPVPQIQRGDIITILSPRTSSIVVTPPPALPVRMSGIQPFPWAATAQVLDDGPPEAGLARLTSVRARVYEPMVRWLEPIAVDFPESAPPLPASGLSGWTSPGLRLWERPLSLEDLPRPCDGARETREEGSDGEDAAFPRPAFGAAVGQREPDTRLAPDLAGTLAGRVRFGYRRPRRHRIQVTPEEPCSRPAISSGNRAILSPMIGSPAGQARRLTASAAKPSAKPLPHFAAVPVPVRPQGFDYVPDLNPIAITANWLASTVPIPVTLTATRLAIAPSPHLLAEFAPATPSRAAETRQLDNSAALWAVPPLAPRVDLPWSISTNTVMVPAGPEEGSEDFAPAPRVVTRTTSMRAVVPAMRRRIKMEVRLEPPQSAPWFEPLTCAFGGDPYGSR